MKRTLLFYLIILFVFTTVYSQRVQTLNKTGSTEIFLDEKVDGFGPGGNLAAGFAPNELIDSITFKAYPVLKNLPDSLTELQTYTYIIDPNQFYYQSYRNGIYSKDFFLQRYKNREYDLKDTTMLTSKMVRCYFSFAVGYDRNKVPKYVIDTNGNNDFSDDQLFTLEKNFGTLNVPEGRPKSINIEYFNGEKVNQENTLCLLFLGSSPIPDEISVRVSFPQYRYAIVSYEGKSFYLCSGMFDKAIYSFPERPNFKSLSNDYLIKPHQIVTIGDAYFKYLPISQNLDKIKLTSGFSDSDKEVLNAKPTIQATPRPLVAEQVGMMAPEIKGVNVQDGTILSLNALRGKYVFLDFWATSCAPCILEFPYIRKVYDTFSSDQLIILGICEDDYI